MRETRSYCLQDGFTPYTHPTIHLYLAVISCIRLTFRFKSSNHQISEFCLSGRELNNLKYKNLRNGGETKNAGEISLSCFRDPTMVCRQILHSTAQRFELTTHLPHSKILQLFEVSKQHAQEMDS